MKTTLKRKAVTSQGTLRETFDDEANSSIVGGQVSFVNLESSMYKRGKLNRPNVPRAAEDAIFLLDDCSDHQYKYKRYLAFIINEPANGEFALGFMSPKWFTALQVDSESLLQADATSYVVPNSIINYLTFSFSSNPIPCLHFTSLCHERLMNSRQN